MTIAEVAKKYEISADTIRYYERVGVIPPVTREKNGIRNFTEEDCNWVYYAKVMRAAGVSVEKLIEYVKLFQMGIDTVHARKSLLIEQYETMGEQLRALQETYNMLGRKIEGYEERILAYEENKLRKK